MAVVYKEKIRDKADLHIRAIRLLIGADITKSEYKNNIEMLTNILAHTMLYVGELEDRIAKLEKRGD